jgi:ethanolamine ammonia-lyase small subunit
MREDGANPWTRLKDFTSARVAIGRAGCSLPTSELLAFGLAQAQARDAVHASLRVAQLAAEVNALGLAAVTVHSQAANRDEYVRRPDLGRRLDEASRSTLVNLADDKMEPQLLFVIADGLSATACQRHAIPLLSALLPRLTGWRVGPVVIAEQARVALGDDIGEILKAGIVVVLVGERPGLSSPDSLGVYITFQPKRERSDAERNCISNIRPGGLAYDTAAYRLHHLLEAAWKRQLTGVALKDESSGSERLLK